MNKYKTKITIILTVFSFLLVVPSGVLAFAPEVRKEIKEEIKERAATRPGLMQKIDKKIGRAAIIGGSLTAKNGMVLTINKDGKTYTVNTDEKTQLRRRFWGKATLDEMTVGDILNVHGKWTDEAKTTIQAVLIRDESIQKRNGVFFGTVKTLSASGWVMDTINRGSQTVTVSSSTRIVNRIGQTISQSDVAVGNRVRVKGLWDNQANTITEVTHVKDFSLPTVPTPSK